MKRATIAALAALATISAHAQQPMTPKDANEHRDFCLKVSDEGRTIAEHRDAGWPWVAALDRESVNGFPDAVRMLMNRDLVLFVYFNSHDLTHPQIAARVFHACMNSGASGEFLANLN